LVKKNRFCSGKYETSVDSVQFIFLFKVVSLSNPFIENKINLTASFISKRVLIIKDDDNTSTKFKIKGIIQNIEMKFNFSNE
jgi:hypothetical protein